MTDEPITDRWRRAMAVNEQTWLELAYDQLRVELLPVPSRHSRVIVTYGFPTGRGRAGAAPGATYPQALQDGRSVILIHPREWTDPINVLAKLAHEMLHLYYSYSYYSSGLQYPDCPDRPDPSSHSASFCREARVVGFEGSIADAIPGPSLVARFEQLLAKLPPFPKSSFDPAHIRKVPTRMELYECECQPPIKVRHAGRKFQATCHLCGGSFLRPQKGANSS